MNETRSLHLLGALGAARLEMVDKKEYLVVPVVALMEGVIHAVNAETPEFVPFSTLQKCAESWNGKPITIGHPKRNGVQCSAQDDGIISAVGIGRIRNARVDSASKKMLMDALIETSKAKRLHPDMYQRLAEGGTEEVSVGALVISDHKTGTHTNGKPYVGTWTHAEGDHLAFLPGGRGACSVAMGCGTHRAAMRVCGDHLEDEVSSIIDPDTLRCLRDIPQSERDQMSESDFAGPGQSFPIKTQADVDAASHLVGKAKDPATVKARIIAIAKKKGLKLPDAWMKAAADGDTPEQDDAEEAAELIAYRSMRAVWDACDPQWDQVSELIDALIADETENPTETDAEEEAEEQVETARVESIRMLCQSMIGALSGIVNATYGSALRDDDAMPMRAMAGARHNMADTKAIQAVHDHAMSLGATCDRSNYKQLESKLGEPEVKLKPVNLNDPVKRYIERVRAGAR